MLIPLFHGTLDEEEGSSTRDTRDYPTAGNRENLSALPSVLEYPGRVTRE